MPQYQERDGEEDRKLGGKTHEYKRKCRVKEAGRTEQDKVAVSLRGARRGRMICITIPATPYDEGKARGEEGEEETNDKRIIDHMLPMLYL